MNYSANTLARASLVRYWKHGDAAGTNGANAVLDSKFGPGATNATTMPPGAGASAAFGLAPLLPGDPATSASYDGADDFLDTNYQHNYATGITWIGWIKTLDAQGGLYADMATASEMGTELFLLSGLVNLDLFPAAQTIFAPTPVNDGLLHMIAITWDGAVGGQVRIYVDGVVAASAPRNVGGLIATSSRRMILGDVQNTGGTAPAPNPNAAFYLSSGLGHVSIDNVALTGPQMAAIYADGSTSGAVSGGEEGDGFLSLLGIL